MTSTPLPPSNSGILIPPPKPLPLSPSTAPPSHVTTPSQPTTTPPTPTLPPPTPAKPIKPKKNDRKGHCKTEAELAHRFVPVVQKREGRDQLKFHLQIRQQPRQAKVASMTSYNNRRPIEPPPVIQLTVRDNTPNKPDSLQRRLRKSKGSSNNENKEVSVMANPYLFMLASIAKDDDTGEELHMLPDKSRCTIGTSASSLYHLRDTDNSNLNVFVFPDISLKIEGRYKLKFSLFEIVGTEVHFCSNILSDAFTCYSPQHFPGPGESTLISRQFADQGLKMRVRKEIRVRTPKRRADSRGHGDPTGSESERGMQGSVAKRPRLIEGEPRREIVPKGDVEMLDARHQLVLQNTGNPRPPQWTYPLQSSPLSLGGKSYTAPPSRAGDMPPPPLPRTVATRTVSLSTPSTHPYLPTPSHTPQRKILAPSYADPGEQHADPRIRPAMGQGYPGTIGPSEPRYRSFTATAPLPPAQYFHRPAAPPAGGIQTRTTYPPVDARTESRSFGDRSHFSSEPRNHWQGGREKQPVQIHREDSRPTSTTTYPSVSDRISSLDSLVLPPIRSPIDDRSIQPPSHAFSTHTSTAVTVAGDSHGSTSSGGVVEGGSPSKESAKFKMGINHLLG